VPGRGRALAIEANFSLARGPGLCFFPGEIMRLVVREGQRGPPSRAELEAARGRRVRDLIAPELRVLFCGINPSLYTAAVGYHFARPGNRFWKTIHAAGFTERVLDPSEQHLLLARGVGLTNVVARASVSADELELAEYRRGGALLARKLRRYQPRVLAFLGLGAYRIAAERPEAKVGRQPDRFADVEVWALPNPSGLNAHYRFEDLVECYAALARAALAA
jgi:TDG/mug DNA glycosylase family protein